MKENKKFLKGFTIAEILISMIVLSVIIAAGASLVTVGKLTLGASRYAQACISQNNGDIASNNCQKAILSCKYNLGKSCQSLLYIANGSIASSAESAKTVLKETCRQGGSKACDYFIEQCVADSTKCDVSGSTNDLRYFLDLDTTDSSAGKTYVYNKVSKWYKDGITNIMNEVNNACQANGAGIACTIYLKQKVYNFDRSERAEFSEQDPINGTVFDSGMVKLLIQSGALCWGYNGNGQLGNSSTKNALFPTRVVGGHDFQSIAITHGTSCAIEKGTNYVWCWGLNANGQLGNGSTTSSAVPVNAKNLDGSNFILSSITANVAMSDGGSTAASPFCGLDSLQQAWCWGINSSGQLGDGTTATKTRPVKVKAYAGTPASFIYISPGYSHTCGIDSTHQGWCWGNNSYGQLGNGTFTSNLVPQKVVDATGNPYYFNTIEASLNMTCALDTAGVPWCWGDGTTGKFPASQDINVLNPTKVVDSVGNPISLKFIGQHARMLGQSGSCGIDDLSNIWTWGRYASKSTSLASYNFTYIGAGYGYFCGLNPSGTAYCWGLGSYGSLGSGTTASYSSPHAVDGGHTFSSLSVGGTNGYSVCGIDTANQAWCWGDPFYNYPTVVKDGSGNIMNFKEVSIFASRYFLDMAGNVWNSTPSQISSGIVLHSLTAGSSFGCALDVAGNAYCWGTNGSGQLGSGNSTAYSSPHAVSAGGKQFSFIVAGVYHTCAIDKDTNYGWCWGSNSRGQLGNGTTTASNIPVLVTDTAGNPYTFSSIITGRDYSGTQYTCALDLSKQVWCWGGSKETLGTGVSPYTKNPIRATASKVFTSLSLAGYPSIYALDSSNDLWVWSGKVSGHPKYTSISPGSGCLCGIDLSNNAWCSGYNTYGQLAVGYTSNWISTPTLISGYKFSSISSAGYHVCGILLTGTASTPVSYWLSTTTANHVTDINKIISVGITQSADNANAYIKWLVSFDNWATCKTWDSAGSVWVAAADCSAASAVNTSDDIVQGLQDYEFASGAGSLDFKAVLYNTDGVTIPDIDQVVVNYY